MNEFATIPRRRLTRCAVLLLLSLLALALPSFRAPAAEVSGTQTVIVPYDSQKPVAQQNPNELYVPYEEFLNLWEAAKANRRGAPPLPPAAIPYALTAARYDGRVADRAVTFTATLDLLTGENDGWQKVPLPFSDVKLTGLTLDGHSAALEDDEILVEKPGRHRLEVTFEIPLAAGATEFQWGIPRSAATLVTLKLPQPAMSATITPGSGSVEHLVDGAKEIVAALGAADQVHVALTSAAAAARITKPAAATIRSKVYLDAGAEETNAEIAFSFPGARLDHFVIFFDAGLNLSDLAVSDLQSWKLRPDGGRQALELTLGNPVPDALPVRLAVRRPLGALPVEGKAPEFSVTAGRVEVTSTALAAPARLELTALPAAGLRQVPLREGVPPGERAAGEFAGTGALGWRLAYPPATQDARINYLYQVNRRQIELFASLQLLSNGADLFATAVDLPPGFTVQAVRSERLQDWWRDGDRLHVRFRGGTPPMTELVLYLVREEKAAPASLEVRPLGLAGFRKITGEAVVAAHKGVDVAMQLKGSAKEVAPEQVAKVYQVLAPLERKRGFTFDVPDFTAQLTLAAAPVKMLATWAMDAEAHEGWTALSIKARLILRQGSVDQIRFTLPAALPEARVNGPDIRETRSHVEAGHRVYEVQFQNDIYESVEFTVDLELPDAPEVTLPAIAFPDAQRTTGYVLVDNASEGEMELVTDGVDPAPASEVPWLPSLSHNARIFRVQPAWTVKVAIERLEKAAGRAAFCAWADLTTAVRADGTEWDRAIWHLQNRALQFLPVSLPDGAELMSVRVAGQSVRADSGTVNGQPAVLVPLIKTKPGELSYDVEVVYRATGTGLGWWSHRKLADPELLGITVERTFWNVWLPSGWRMRDVDGNMEPVIGEVAEADKLSDAVEELKQLGSIARSDGTDVAVRRKALYNWRELEKSIATANTLQVEAPKDLEAKDSKAAVKPKAAQAQNGYIIEKQRAVNEELGRQVQQLKDLDGDGFANEDEWREVGKKAPNQPVAPAAGPQSAPVAGRFFGGGTTGTWTSNTAVPPMIPGLEAPAQNPGKPAQAGKPETNENYLYLNDNVVLQQQAKETPQAAPPPAPPAKWSDSAGLGFHFKDTVNGNQAQQEVLRGMLGQQTSSFTSPNAVSSQRVINGVSINAQQVLAANAGAKAAKPAPPASPSADAPNANRSETKELRLYRTQDEFTEQSAVLNTARGNGIVAERELARRTGQMDRGEAAIRAGDEAVKNHDYEQAFTQYRAACDMIPNAVNSANLYQRALRDFCDAGVSLAEQRISEGRSEDATNVLTTILRDQYDPHFNRALTLLAQIPTSVFTSHPATPKYLERVEQVKQWMSEAKGFFDTARWDLAYKRAEQILGVDPYNIAARKLEEELDRKRDDNAVAGYNNTRAHAIWQLDKGWDMPLQRFGVTAAGTFDQSAHPETPQAHPELRPEGRLSLAVDFPTEGQVIHFKKVKANAALDLSIVKQGAFARWQNLALFALLATALWLLQRHFEGRRFSFTFRRKVSDPAAASAS